MNAPPLPPWPVAEKQPESAAAAKKDKGFKAPSRDAPLASAD